MPVFDKILWSKPPCLDIYYDEPPNWLVKVLGYSRVASPQTFGLRETLDCVAVALGEPDRVLL